ncbi:MAG: hypothetical protein ACOYYJ_16935 [Chloroflexota bacterium]
MDTTGLHRPAAWGETLAALGFLLMFPLFFLLGLLLTPLLEDVNDPGFGLGILFTATGMVLAALVIGWVKDFPRWVFPYWGMALLISLYMHSFTGTIAGYQVRGGWWVWTPLVGVALVGWLWRRSVKPVSALLRSLWQDWTLPSFAFYGALPLLVIAAYDEVHDKGFFVTLILVILGIGAIGYMRTQTPWRRFAWLLGGFTLGWTILMSHQVIYWNGRQDPGMPKPVTWQDALGWTSEFGATLLLILAAPVVIAFLRRAAEARHNPVN